MRILTVRQPWAWAIIHGQKSVENRSRNVAGDYRGPVAIHGGLSLDPDAFAHPALHAAWSRLRDNDQLSGGWSDGYMGAIIGVVDLVDVHHATGCAGRIVVENVGPHLVRGYRAVTCSPWAETGVFHLVLANPRPLAEPIPYRGALGLRKLDADTIARIEAAS